MASEKVECPRCLGDGGDRYTCGQCGGRGTVTKASVYRTEKVYTQAQMDAAIDAAIADQREHTCTRLENHHPQPCTCNVCLILAEAAGLIRSEASGEGGDN